MTIDYKEVKKKWGVGFPYSYKGLSWGWNGWDRAPNHIFRSICDPALCGVRMGCSNGGHFEIPICPNCLRKAVESVPDYQEFLNDAIAYRKHRHERYLLKCKRNEIRHRLLDRKDKALKDCRTVLMGMPIADIEALLPMLKQKHRESRGLK